MQELQLCLSCLSLGENNGAATFLLLSQGQQQDFKDFKNHLQTKKPKNP